MFQTPPLHNRIGSFGDIHLKESMAVEEYGKLLKWFLSDPKVWLIIFTFFLVAVIRLMLPVFKSLVGLSQAIKERGDVGDGDDDVEGQKGCRIKFHDGKSVCLTCKVEDEDGQRGGEEREAKIKYVRLEAFFEEPFMEPAHKQEWDVGESRGEDGGSAGDDAFNGEAERAERRQGQQESVEGHDGVDGKGGNDGTAFVGKPFEKG